MNEQLKITGGVSDEKGITFYIKGISYGIRAYIGKYGEIRTNKDDENVKKSIVLIMLILFIARVLIYLFKITNWLYHIPTIIFILWTIASFVFMISETETLKYHAAEHKVANCWIKYKKLDIDLVRTCSRIHNSCGTNIMIEITVFQIVSSVCMIFFDFHVPEIITAAAPFLLYNRFPFNILGCLVQGITTTEPDEKHLLVGICALEEMLKTAEKEMKTIDE